MSGRVVYYYERTALAEVDDIEHVESQSMANYGVVKIFFQPNVNSMPPSPRSPPFRRPS